MEMTSSNPFTTQESIMSTCSYQSIAPLSTQQSSSFVFLCVDESVDSMRAFDWFYNNFYRENHLIGIVHVYSPQRISIGGTKYEDHVERYFKSRRNTSICVTKEVYSSSCSGKRNQSLSVAPFA